MCEPMTIAATAMAVTQGASQIMQYQQADAQAEYQNEMFEKNRERSYDALARRYGDIGDRQSQEQQAAAERKEELTRQARAKMASARVAAGESGVTGTSVDLALRDISGAAARDRSTVDQNLDWTMQQLQRQKTSAQSNAVNRITSVRQGQKPSSTALGINLANTAAQGAMQYDSVSPKSGGGGSSPSTGSGSWASQVNTGGY